MHNLFDQLIVNVFFKMLRLQIIFTVSTVYEKLGYLFSRKMFRVTFTRCISRPVDVKSNNAYNN